jgi:hypothetical protein
LNEFNASPLLYLYNCQTDLNENINNEVFSFWSVLRLLLGNDNSEVVFSYWSVMRLLPEEQEVRFYYLSERPLERGNILDKSTQIAKG